MQYWGKLLGIIMGFISGCGIWGMILGLLVGHMIDMEQGINTIDLNYFLNEKTRKDIFFRITFQVMGYISKSKGRITKQDIHNANLIMTKMHFNEVLKRSAQQAFYEGKNRNFPLHSHLCELRHVCFGRFDLIHMFIEIQIQAATYNGVLHNQERQILCMICEELGINYIQFEELLNSIQDIESEDSESFNSHEYTKTHQKHEYSNKLNIEIDNAYKVLGVCPKDDVFTIKRAYRKMMSIHHPDKLIAKGCSPEMMEIAKKKTQTIQKSYDLLKQEKNFL